MWRHHKQAQACLGALACLTLCSPAVATAFAYLCDPGPDLDLVVLEEWFEEAEAHALAEVRTPGAAWSSFAAPSSIVR